MTQKTRPHSLEPVHNDKDKELLGRLSQGDEQAFTGLFYAYKDKLYSFLYKLSGSAEMAEDTVQNIFLSVWQNRATIAEVRNINAFLFRMAQNDAINALRRQSRKALILAELGRDPGQEPDSGEIFAGREIKKALYDALDRLPAQQRRIFELCRLQGLSYDEVANSLGITTSTVRNHLVAATRMVREFIAANYPLGTIYCILLLLPLV